MSSGDNPAVAVVGHNYLLICHHHQQQLHLLVFPKLVRRLSELLSVFAVVKRLITKTEGKCPTAHLLLPFYFFFFLLTLLLVEGNWGL